MSYIRLIIKKLFLIINFLISRPSQNIEENWRSGRKSISESDDGRRTPQSHSVPLTNTAPPVTVHQQSPPSNYKSSHQPGVLVLPDQTQLSSTNVSPRQHIPQPQRTLFDPNNPNKPIIVSPSGNRITQIR